MISVETHLAGQVYPGSREDILQLLVDQVIMEGQGLPGSKEDILQLLMDQVIMEGHGLPWLQGGYSSAVSGSGNPGGSWSTLAPGRIFFSC